MKLAVALLLGLAACASAQRWQHVTVNPNLPPLLIAGGRGVGVSSKDGASDAGAATLSGYHYTPPEADVTSFAWAQQWAGRDDPKQPFNCQRACGAYRMVPIRPEPLTPAVNPTSNFDPAIPNNYGFLCALPLSKVSTGATNFTYYGSQFFDESGVDYCASSNAKDEPVVYDNTGGTLTFPTSGFRPNRPVITPVPGDIYYCGCCGTINKVGRKFKCPLLDSHTDADPPPAAPAAPRGTRVQLVTSSIDGTVNEACPVPTGETAPYWTSNGYQICRRFVEPYVDPVDGTSGGDYWEFGTIYSTANAPNTPLPATKACFSFSDYNTKRTGQTFDRLCYKVNKYSGPPNPPEKPYLGGRRLL